MPPRSTARTKRLKRCQSIERVQDINTLESVEFVDDFGDDRGRLAKLRLSFLEKKKESQAAKAKQVKPALLIQSGESLVAFGQRLRIAAQPAISELMGQVKAIRQKRKAYLSARKKSKKLKQQAKRGQLKQESPFLVDRVSFGERVQEPPKLTARPRPILKQAPQVGPAVTGPVQRSLRDQEDIERLRSAAIHYYRNRKQARLQNASRPK